MVKTRHLFKLSAMVDKMGIDEELKLFTKKGTKGLSQEEVGQSFVFAMVKKLHRAEEETIAFIAAATGKTTEEISEMGIKELIEIFKGILKEEGVLDFLSSQQTD